MSAPNRTTTSTVADQTAQPTSQQTSQPSWPLSPYQIQMSYAASPSGGQNPGQSPPSGGIARGSGADWFGPLNPLNPIAPPDIAGRRFDFPVGYNLVIRPRAYEPVGFHELRAFADAYDLLRLVIETRKDQMERQRWRIRPRSSPSHPSPARGGGLGKGRKNAAIDADMSARIVAVERFLQKPDGVTRWKAWLRSLLEDMFVIDAATLYCQRTRSGQLFALQQLDGATIKRVIDDWGRTPQPYVDADGSIIFPPAFQQVLKGLPAVNYSARDIIYRPRNVRAHRVYGYSPVQQVLMTVNIALRRQLWQLDYFTEGSIPDALIGVPQGWTPDQIKQFQDYWDTEFSGDLAKRRRAKFVPGDTAAKVVQTKEPQHKDDFDEWLARIICFAFSVPPQWAVKAMNRATADNQSAQAEEEGLEPTKEWVKDLIDEVIAEEFASPDLELVWLDEDTDAAQAEAHLESRVKLGAVTLNEMRDSLGLDPFANPAANRPMVLTATGYVPIEANAGGQANTFTNASGAPIVNPQNASPTAKRVLSKDYDPEEPRVPKHNTGGGEWTREGIQFAQAEGPPIFPVNPRQSTGISQIDNVTDKLAEILTKTVNGLARLPGQPQRYGRIVHAAFAVAVIAEGIRGISPLDVEWPFRLPPDYSSTKRSVIPDVVLRNDIGDIIAIYDVKTGDASVDPWRARELRAATDVGPDVPIIVLHPREITLKTWSQSS
jgi:hypothetical protein